MLNIQLDPETEARLVEILAKEKTTSDELIKRLVKERWLSYNPAKRLSKDVGDILNIC